MPRTEAVQRENNPVKRVFLLLGPGLVTGASDDDPSGIGTYAVAGAKFGYLTLWTALICLPLMTATQIICSRIGQVTGEGLAGTLRRHYPRWLLYGAIGLLVAANTLNAGADIGAIAAAANLLVPIPIAVMVVPIGATIVLIQFFGSYRVIASTFKWLTLALLAYVAAAIFANPDTLAVLQHTFIPTFRLDNDYIAVLVAILGTTISPYLWFWQASQEVEEEKSEGKRTIAKRRGATEREKEYSAVDTVAGMLTSQIVMYFIILTTGATLFATGKHDVSSAADAAAALKPIAGSAATLLLAVGLIGAGLLAVPVLTGSSAYAVSELTGREHGLDKKPRQAKVFYAVIGVSTLVGLGINFVGINPISALILSAVINGIAAPPILLLVMLIASKEVVMGNDRPGPVVNSLGWITFAAMTVAAVALVATL